MRIPLLLAIPAASVAVLLLSACSGGSDSTTVAKSAAVSAAANPSDSVLVSLNQSTAAKTAQMDVTANLAGLPVVGAQKVTGNGAVDFAAQKAQAHFDLLGLSVDGIVDGTTAYAKSPILGDTSWYRSDLKTADAQGASGFASVWTNMIDPAQLFSNLKDAAGSMTQVGHEQVRGADTIHYKGAIDLVARARAAGAPAASIDGLKNSGASTVPVDVWVDAQGLIARVQTALSVSGAQAGHPGQFSGDVNVEFHDYGKAVTITPPPAAQVKDLSQALTGFGGLNSDKAKRP